MREDFDAARVQLKHATADFQGASSDVLSKCAVSSSKSNDEAAECLDRLRSAGSSVSQLQSLIRGFVESLGPTAAENLLESLDTIETSLQHCARVTAAHVDASRALVLASTNLRDKAEQCWQLWCRWEHCLKDSVNAVSRRANKAEVSLSWSASYVTAVMFERTLWQQQSGFNPAHLSESLQFRSLCNDVLQHINTTLPKVPAGEHDASAVERFVHRSWEGERRYVPPSEELALLERLLKDAQRETSHRTPTTPGPRLPFNGTSDVSGKTPSVPRFFRRTTTALHDLRRVRKCVDGLRFAFGTMAHAMATNFAELDTTLVGIALSVPKRIDKPKSPHTGVSHFPSSASLKGTSSQRSMSRFPRSTCEAAAQTDNQNKDGEGAERFDRTRRGVDGVASADGPGDMLPLASDAPSLPESASGARPLLVPAAPPPTCTSPISAAPGDAPSAVIDEHDSRPTAVPIDVPRERPIPKRMPSAATNSLNRTNSKVQLALDRLERLESLSAAIHPHPPSSPGGRRGQRVDAEGKEANMLVPEEALTIRQAPRTTHQRDVLTPQQRSRYNGWVHHGM
jgi:hypothetical protein